jgi:hypothetical protein
MNGNDEENERIRKQKRIVEGITARRLIRRMAQGKEKKMSGWRERK